jgi:hypothetical protein
MAHRSTDMLGFEPCHTCRANIFEIVAHIVFFPIRVEKASAASTRIEVGTTYERLCLPVAGVCSAVENEQRVIFGQES